MSAVKDVANQAREYIKLTQRNIVELAGTAIMKQEIKGKVKMKDGLPVLDIEGNEIHYPSIYQLKIVFTGGELQTNIDEDMFKKVKEGDMYLLKGRIGMVREFGQDKIGWYFTSIEDL